MSFQSVFTDKFPKHLPVIPFNPISPVKSMGHSFGKHAKLVLESFLSTFNSAEFEDRKMIKTRFLASGCFRLAVETRHCVPITPYASWGPKGTQRRRLYFYWEKSVCVCVCAHSGAVRRVLDSGRQLPREGDFVTGLKPLFYLFLGEALSGTESLCAWDSSLIKYR